LKYFANQQLISKFAYKTQQNRNNMSEQELNSYRFLSGQEPTDEMLHAIMAAACESALKKAEEAQLKYENDYRSQYNLALKKWGHQIAAIHNEQQ
jgi:membrane-anchored protein YejM (alkaline phosphatase superfamily)